MFTSVELSGPLEAWARPAAKPLDEAVWQAWVAKGRAEDRRRSVARMKAVKWVSMAGLLAAAVLWSPLAPYDVLIRFVLASCAMGLMLQAFQTRRYLLMILFGALTLLYNPVAPAFNF